jgi:predicted transcriptional regulator
MPYGRKLHRKPGRRVLRDGRSEPAREPYASIRVDLIASATYRALSGAAMRIHLLLESNYVPDRELYLPHKVAVRKLRLSFTTVGKAFAELIEAGIVRKLRDGWRPGKMGGQSEGRAAVYDLPHRRAEGVPVWKQPGDLRLQGKWRIHCERVRKLAAQLSNEEIKPYLWLHAVDRRKDGSPAENEGRPLTAERLRMPRATLHRALQTLVDRGLIKRTQRCAGRRPGYYRLASSETKGVRSARARPK